MPQDTVVARPGAVDDEYRGLKRAICGVVRQLELIIPEASDLVDRMEGQDAEQVLSEVERLTHRWENAEHLLAEAREALAGAYDAETVSVVSREVGE